MPVSAGSLYDYYNPLAGTQRNLDRFVDLYERKKQRGMQEKELGLRERSVGVQERQESRMAESQGIEDQYRQTLINKETAELQMKQDLMNDPGTRVTIMSKSLKQANKMAGKKGVDNVLKSFQANPKYQEDAAGYTADDIQFTEDGLMVMPVRDKSTGEKIPGYFGFTDEKDQPHIIDTNKFNQGTTVNVGGKAETKEQEGIGTYRSKIYEGIQDDAKTARSEIDNYSTLQELMNKTNTGALEGAKTQIASYAQSMGVPVNNRWSVNQTIEAISNKLTIMARKVGEGQILAGQISDSDRKFLKASVPGLDKMPNANKMLIDWNIKIAQRKIDNAEMADEYFDANGTMKGFNEVQRKWAENHPLFGDTSKPSLDAIFKGQ